MRDWSNRGYVKPYRPRRRQGKCWHCKSIGAKGAVVPVKGEENLITRYKWVCDRCLRKSYE